MAINKVVEWVKLEKLEEIEVIRRRQVKALEIAAKAAWNAWQASIREARSVTEVDGDHPTTTVKTEEELGDPRYLAEYRACLADIRKIWGADKPPELPDESGFRWAGKPREQALSEYAAEQIDFLQGMLKSAPGN